MVIPSRFSSETQQRFTESERGCQRQIAPSRPGKQATREAGERDGSPWDAGPSPRGEAQPPFPPPFLLPGEPWQFGGPQVWDGNGSGKLVLRFPLSPLASWAPEQPRLPFSGPQYPSAGVFSPRPLTPDPPSPKRLPRQVRQAS